MGKAKSRWWVAPELVAALERGESFEAWLAGRRPVASAARISTDLKRDAHGVADQHASNERHAATHGLAIVKYYEDNDISAAKEELTRDAFELLVKELRNRRTAEGFRICGVMCLERERLYRRAGDYERIVDALMVEDDGLLVENGRFFDLYGDSAEIEGLIGVAQSKREIRKIRQRMRNSHLARAAKGKAVGGPRRFGWLGPDKRLDRPSNTVKNPAEWPILEQMIKDAVAGKAWLTIADELNAAGVVTAAGSGGRRRRCGIWCPTFPNAQRSLRFQAT